MQRPRDEQALSDTAKILKVVVAEAGQEHPRGTDMFERVGGSWDEAAKKAAENAHTSVVMTLPVYTTMGVAMTFAKKGDLASVMNAIGPFVAIGGFFIDVIKFPFCLGYAGVEITHAGVAKAISAIKEGSPKHEFEKRMMGSFITRFAQTAQLLCALGVVTPEAMQAKLKNADINDLIGLTLLHTAFASRHTQVNSLILADGKILREIDCPAEGRALFDLCIQARNVILEALGGLPQRHDSDLYMRESTIVAEWIRIIYAGKAFQPNEMPAATPKSLELVNRLIDLNKSLTVYAKEIIPVTDKEVGRRVMSRK